MRVNNPKRARYTPEMLKAMIKSDEEIEISSWLKRIYAGRNIAERISVLRELAQKGLKDPEYITVFKEVIRRGKFLQELQAIEEQFRSDRLRCRNPSLHSFNTTQDLKDIVVSKQGRNLIFRNSKKVFVDVKTADVLLRLFYGLSGKDKEKFVRMLQGKDDFGKLADFALRTVRNPKMPKNFLGPGDREFIIYKLEPYFRLRAIEMRWSNSKKHYPDIWMNMRPSIERTDYGHVPVYVPVITVTAEWRSHSEDLRRSQLVHECLHVQGLQHEKIGKWDYNTHYELDTYSPMIYRKIIGR